MNNSSTIHIKLKKIKELEDVLSKAIRGKYRSCNMILDLMDIPHTMVYSTHLSQLIKLDSELAEYKGALKILLNEQVNVLTRQLGLNSCLDISTNPQEASTKLPNHRLIRFSLKDVKIKEVRDLRKGEVLSIGRGNCDIDILDMIISRKQGSIQYFTENWSFRPANEAKNPTYINFRHVAKREVKLAPFSYLTFGKLSGETALIEPDTAFSFDESKPNKVKKYEHVKLHEFFRTVQIKKSSKWECVKNNIALFSNIVNQLTVDCRETVHQNILDLTMLLTVKYFGDFSMLLLQNDGMQKVRIRKSDLLLPLTLFSRAKKVRECYRWDEEDIYKIVVSLDDEHVLYVETKSNEWNPLEEGIEFNDIDDFFYTFIYFTQTLFSNLKKVVENNQNIYLSKEIEEGEEFQRYFWPKKPEFPGLQLHLQIHQSRKVGGDFGYAWQNKEDSRYYIAFGDTQHHGVRSSLMTTYIIGILATHFCLDYDHEVHHIVDRVNKVCLTLPERIITQFILLQWDKESLIYSNAGFNIPFVYSKKSRTVEDIALHHGTVLGVSKSITYKRGKIDLEEEDTVIFFTDGITEALNKEQEEFSADRVKQVFARECRRGSSLEEIANNVLKELKDFLGYEEPADDMSILLIKKTYSELRQQTQTLRIPPLPFLREEDL